MIQIWDISLQSSDILSQAAISCGPTILKNPSRLLLKSREDVLGQGLMLLTAQVTCWFAGNSPHKVDVFSS